MNRINWGKAVEFTGPQHYFRESMVVRAVRKYVKPGSNILDLGSGGGSLVFRLAGFGFRMTACDASREAVNYLKEKIKEKSMENKIRAVVADAAKLPFKNSTFDTCTAGEILEHIKDDGIVLKESYRILKDKGILIITVPARPEIYGEIDRLAGHARRYSREILAEKVVAAGFRIITIFDWGFPMTNLWQKHILIRAVKNIAVFNNKKRCFGGMIHSSRLAGLGSFIFWLDMIFRNTGKGYSLFLVAVKN